MSIWLRELRARSADLRYEIAKADWSDSDKSVQNLEMNIELFTCSNFQNVLVSDTAYMHFLQWLHCRKLLKYLKHYGEIRLLEARRRGTRSPAREIDWTGHTLFTPPKIDSKTGYSLFISRRPKPYAVSPFTVFFKILYLD